MPAATIIAAIIGAAAAAAATAATAAQSSMQSNDDRGFVISNALPVKLTAVSGTPVHGVWATTASDIVANESANDILQAWFASGDPVAAAVQESGVTKPSQLNSTQALSLKLWYQQQDDTAHDEPEPLMVHALGAGVKAMVAFDITYRNSATADYWLFVFVHHEPNAGTTTAGAMILEAPNFWGNKLPLSFDPGSMIDAISTNPAALSTGGTTIVRPASTPAGWPPIRVRFAAGLVTTFEIEPDLGANIVDV